MRYSLIFTFLFIPFLFLLFFIKNEYLDKSIIKENTEFFISKDTSFEDVVNQLDSFAIDFHPLAKLFFNQFIEKKRLQYWYTSGRFMLQKGSSLNDVVNKIRSRSQDPTKLTFNSMDDILDVFGIMDSTLDLDSLDMLNYLNLNNYPLDSLYLLLIPNTYELYWDISPKEFLNRMRLEYNNFWTEERINSANQIISEGYAKFWTTDSCNGGIYMVNFDENGFTLDVGCTSASNVKGQVRCVKD